MTYSKFIERHWISMTAERVDANPNMADSHEMDHWRCSLIRRDYVVGGHFGHLRVSTPIAARMTTYFSMGYGHHGAEPKTKDVLSSLASDSASVEQSPFEVWALDLGYTEDSRKAERIYKTCQRQAEKLERFLGRDLFQELLYHTTEDGTGEDSETSNESEVRTNG